MRQNSQQRTLMVGSTYPAHHGQAVAFRSAIRCVTSNKRVLETSFKAPNRMRSALLAAKYSLSVLHARAFYRPDAVYFLCSRTRVGFLRDLWLLTIFRNSAARIVNHLHGSNFREFYEALSPFGQRLVRWAHSRVDRHIVLHESMMDQLSMVADDEKVSVIENFVTGDCATVPPNSTTPDQRLKLIYLSTVREAKGIYVLLDAVRKLATDGCPVELTVYGDCFGLTQSEIDAEEKRFRAALRGLPEVTYGGVIHGEAKFEALERADLFVLPTFYDSEAIPLSILEAMRMGCAVVTTRHNVLPRLLDERNGLLVPVRDVQALAGAISHFSEDRAHLLRIQRHNRELAASRFSETRYQKEVLEAIHGGALSEEEPFPPDRAAS